MVKPCSSGFSFVLVPEEPLSGQAAAVVEFSVRQNSQQRRLAGVDVADDGASHFHEILKS